VSDFVPGRPHSPWTVRCSHLGMGTAIVQVDVGGTTLGETLMPLNPRSPLAGSAITWLHIQTGVPEWQVQDAVWAMWRDAPWTERRT
jgi:hypothetical protein